jgi:peptide methionine sulfoxide reductase msrA/msrB
MRAFLFLMTTMGFFHSCAQQPKNELVNMNDVVTKKAVFASGCFWGTEYYMKRIDGVISTTVGYTGGSVENPTYKEVCTGRTGHYEAIEIVYDPSKVNYETLARTFFETHDPTQMNGQGPDIGSQYRSAIFYSSNEEKQISEQLIALLEAKGNRIATVVLELDVFWSAEEYHQDYYDIKGGTPYCHKYTKRF